MTQTILTGGPRLAEFVALETKVWEALVAGDPEADGQMLTEDFLGVYPSGFSDKSGHCDQLQNGPVMAGYRLRDAQLRIISPDAVLLSYRAAYLPAGTTAWKSMLISSLWEKSAAGWRNSFSQDTPEVTAAPGSPPEHG
ncbi:MULTISPECIES: nuclear transport factor 2 family protein [unclassified Leisingera]|uniref:nuclear transport factor 2 family protein n=1 Tax=unclassified Leisingera TaxID=2614906 RepID=UPI00031BE0C1|nr:MULTISPECIES: nuclear transport factor 2 family protein [unclassified Leisingera]